MQPASSHPLLPECFLQLAAWRPKVLPSVVRRQFPPASYGTAHRLSQPFSGLFLPFPFCHFQTDIVHGVFPSGDYSSYTAPTAHHCQIAFLAFLLRSGPSLPRSRTSCRRIEENLG